MKTYTRKYISPSQANLFYSDRAEYFLKYLAEHKPPPFKQTAPMAVGGSFDSHLTRALAVRYFGANDPRCQTEYNLENMLDGAIQNESLDRVAITRVGLELFKRYLATGAYNRLCLELDAADSITMQDTLYYDAGDGLTLMGKPDIAFVRGGVQHVYDAKVNGFYSQASPLKNHVWKGVGPVGGESVHKAAVLGKHSCGTIVDISGYFDGKYRRQTCTYAWSLLAATEFEPIIVGIEQVACRPASSRWKDATVDGVAVSNVSTRSLVSVEIQKAVMAEYKHMWECITTGWVFDDLSRSESDAECSRLESLAKGLGTNIDEAFNALCGR